MSVCEDSETYALVFGHEKEKDGQSETPQFEEYHLWRVYIHGLNREVFVMAVDADGAESQAGCKYNLSGLKMTTERQPFMMRGWSRHEF
jgi:hypothetical protein